MALKISTQAESGAMGDYWKVAFISRDLIKITGFICAHLYVNKASCLSGKEPLKIIQAMYDPSNHPFTEEARALKNDDQIAEDFLVAQYPLIFGNAETVE